MTDIQALIILTGLCIGVLSLFAVAYWYLVRNL